MRPSEIVAGALCGAIGRMGHAGGMLHERLRVAEAHGAMREIERVHEVLARLQSAVEVERDEAAAGRHLPARDFALAPLRPKPGIAET